MSDTTPSPDPVPVEEGKPSIWERISFIWLIPIIALAVALGAAWNNYNDQGPLIEITFDNAAGVKADETVLRYRDIQVGVVEQVGFTPDLEQVRVSVRIDKELADHIDADARFWVVRPEVSAQGVSGLDTVLSGVYIQGVWDSTPGGLVTRFWARISRASSSPSARPRACPRPTRPSSTRVCRSARWRPQRSTRAARV